MNKITYLFGAGASKNALPIVSEVPDRINTLIDFLNKKENLLSNLEEFENLKLSNKKTKREFQIELVEKLEWLLLESKNHASVDTFAKKLTIKRDYKQLEQLKIVLSVFFVFEQALNLPDKRYDSFFASIHNQLYDFPNNIRILSWNYDNQFELTYSEYSGSSDLHSVQTSLNINHKYGDNHFRDKFGIFKLNGTIGMFSDGGWKQYVYHPDMRESVDIDFIEKVVRNYGAITNISTLKSNFSFSWENESNEKGIVQKSIEATSDSTTLVVIGYSFPFFNREIDRQIISSMKNLKNVYFQAPDADLLIERFKAIRDDLTGIQLLPKFDLEQFVLPNEL